MDLLRTPAIEEAILLFNEGLFFEAHEVWEGVWRRARGEQAAVLQGLIQVAAGFHKAQRGQPSGAAALLARAADRLAAVRHDAPGFDLRPVLDALGTARRAAERMVAAGAAGPGAAGAVPMAPPRLPEPRRRLFLRRILTRIDVDAPAAGVWRVLADFAAYPEWNPFITGIAGDPRPGERLVITLEPPGGRRMTFRPRLAAADEDRELRWLGHFVLPGLFDGEHVFTIAPMGKDRARLAQRETFRGLLVPVMPATLWESTRRGFEAMNRALKQRAA